LADACIAAGADWDLLSVGLLAQLLIVIAPLTNMLHSNVVLKFHKLKFFIILTLAKIVLISL